MQSTRLDRFDERRVPIKESSCVVAICLQVAMKVLPYTGTIAGIAAVDEGFVHMSGTVVAIRAS
jgi:hypothetical protein